MTARGLSGLFKRFRAIAGPSLVCALLAAAAWSWLQLGSIRSAWPFFACTTIFEERVTGLSGYDFEVTEARCSQSSKEPSDVSVVAARTGSSPRRALVFRYARIQDGSAETLPLIMPAEDGTVRLLVDHVASVGCRTRRWDGLLLEYDITRVAHPASAAPPECPAD